MLNAKQLLIVILVALFIAGISMEANAKEVGSGEKYALTCGTLALFFEDEEKARYYAEQVTADIADAELERVVGLVINQVYKYAEVYDVSTAEIARSAFKNYGCDVPFI